MCYLRLLSITIPVFTEYVWDMMMYWINTWVFQLDKGIVNEELSAYVVTLKLFWEI